MFGDAVGGGAEYPVADEVSAVAEDEQVVAAFSGDAGDQVGWVAGAYVDVDVDAGLFALGARGGGEFVVDSLSNSTTCLPRSKSRWLPRDVLWQTPRTNYGLRTNVDLVLEGLLPQDEARLALSEAAVELNSLPALITDLAELARGQERKLRMQEVRLDEIVKTAVERAGTRAPGAIFVTALSSTSVRADALLLGRAVSNLLDNAIKYSPQGAPIQVTV